MATISTYDATLDSVTTASITVDSNSTGTTTDSGSILYWDTTTNDNYPVWKDTWTNPYNNDELVKLFDKYKEQQQKVSIKKLRLNIYRDKEKTARITNIDDIEIGGEYYFEYFQESVYYGPPELYKFYVADMDVFKKDSCIIDIFYTRITNNNNINGASEIDVRAKIYIDYNKNEDGSKDYPPFYFKQKLYDMTFAIDSNNIIKTVSFNNNYMWIDTSSNNWATYKSGS